MQSANAVNVHIHTAYIKMYFVIISHWITILCVYTLKVSRFSGVLIGWCTAANLNIEYYKQTLKSLADFHRIYRSNKIFRMQWCILELNAANISCICVCFADIPTYTPILITLHCKSAKEIGFDNIIGFCQRTNHKLVVIIFTWAPPIFNYMRLYAQLLPT